MASSTSHCEIQFRISASRYCQAVTISFATGDEARREVALGPVLTDERLLALRRLHCWLLSPLKTMRALSGHVEEPAVVIHDHLPKQEVLPPPVLVPVQALPPLPAAWRFVQIRNIQVGDTSVSSF